MKRIATLLCIIAFGMLAASPARAQLVLCNEYDHAVSFAAVTQVGGTVFSETLAYGWLKLRSGECYSVVETTTTKEAFLSVRRITDDGDLLMLHYPAQEMVGGERNHSSGAERVFCVADRDFRLVGRRFEDHETCPAGYHLQMFNLYLGAVSDSKFTLTLGSN